MKKTLSFLLALLMLLGLAQAEAFYGAPVEESAVLSWEEIDTYLVSGAQWTTHEEASADWLFLSPDEPDLRGLQAGDTLEDLLAVYPNFNPGLMGSYYNAVLYVEGEQPEISTGLLSRDGQRVTRIDFAVYRWMEDGTVRVPVVHYALDQGVITGISLLAGATYTEEEALEAIADLRELQEVSDYFTYPQSADGWTLSPFGREDLSFSGLDFLDLNAEMALNALGPAADDQWVQDTTGEWLRIMAWDGVSLVLVYDASRSFLRPDSLTVTADVLEGPRGVRVGDYLDTVIFRFRHSEGGVMDTGMTLYGDGETAPYGLLTYDQEGAALSYALGLEGDQTVLWHLTFVGQTLESMRLLLR